MLQQRESARALIECAEELYGGFTTSRWVAGAGGRVRGEPGLAYVRRPLGHGHRRDESRLAPIDRKAEHASTAFFNILGIPEFDVPVTG